MSFSENKKRIGVPNLHKLKSEYQIPPLTLDNKIVKSYDLIGDRIIKGPLSNDIKFNVKSPAEKKIEVDSDDDYTIVTPKTKKNLYRLPESPKLKLEIPASSRFKIPSQNVNPIGHLNMTNTPKKKVKPDYNLMSKNEQTEYRKDFDAKFRILRNSFPGWNIPIFTEELSLDKIHSIYEDLVKSIVISQNCNQYKIYLILMFFGAEVFFNKVLGLNASGLTMNQIKMMSNYDKLLVELGEQYFSTQESNWPIEIRLIITFGFNTILFMGIKYVSNWGGFGDETVEQLQNVIANVSNNFTNLKIGEDGIHEIPVTSKNSVIDGLLGSLLGGGGDISGLIGQVGNLFGGNQTNKAKGPPVAKPYKESVNWG